MEILKNFLIYFTLPHIIANYINKFRQAAHIIDVPEQLALKIDIEDEDDIKFVKCAVACKANYIISGDKHLLKLKKFGKIKILKVKEFLDIIN